MADRMEERLKRMGARTDGPNTKQAVQGLIDGGMPKAKGATAGRKPCTVCNKRPPDMMKHFGENADTHGPVASGNQHAMNNFPGLKNISENVLGGLMGGAFFNDRRK